MNKHEIFAKVKAHLLGQMERSADGDVCRYRGPNGLACAVGCLIPDEMYEPIIEYQPATSYIVQRHLPFEVTEEIEFLLKELQGIHDYSAPHYWADHLAYAAKIFSIEEPAS